MVSSNTSDVKTLCNNQSEFIVALISTKNHHILNKLPNANILCESRSLNTEENIKYCYRIVKDTDCNILLISCKEHLKKVKNIIDKMSKDINWKLIHSNKYIEKM